MQKHAPFVMPTPPAWRSEPATDKQPAALKRRGIDIRDGVTKGAASDLLDKPTPKMKRLLKRCGVWTEGMTFAEAKEAIGELFPEAGDHDEDGQCY
jgi:hypothetical protein